MGGFAKKLAWSVCGFCVAGIAMASPASRVTPAPSVESYVSRPAQFNRFTRDRPARLDLRAPTLLPAASVASSASSPAFPSAHRTMASPNVEDQLPALGAANRSLPRPMGRAEEITRRMVREGIPFVRLWESHAALVSLGLNQHGKPGLWLIQKVR